MSRPALPGIQRILIRKGPEALHPKASSFSKELGMLFEAEFPRLFRFLDRLSGDPEMAADTAQEAFVKLYGRGAMPDSPQAWLFTVALNLFRNARATRSRRRELLSGPRGRVTYSDPLPQPDEGFESPRVKDRVRRTLDKLPDRERDLLLLRAEGLSYRELAETLQLNESSVGTLLARAKRAFRDAYEGESDAP